MLTDAIPTTTICAVMAEYDESRNFTIIGVGDSHSKGLRRGMVVDIDKTINSIELAVEECKKMAGVDDVDGVIVGIAGDHIRSLNSHGVIAIGQISDDYMGETGTVKGADVDRVLNRAETITLAPDRQILHVEPQEFIVDDQSGIKDPIGMVARRLEAKAHIVHGASTSVQNLTNCIRGSNMEVQSIVLESLASSFAVLDDDERELGVALVDIGGGTSDIIVFFQGGIKHTGIVPLGGDSITNDIAIIFRTSRDIAESIKIKHGCANASMVSREDIFSIEGIGGRPPKDATREELARVVQPRMKEILHHVKGEIHKSDCYGQLTGGIVLTGGGSLLEGLQELAEEIFELPVKIGYPNVFGGLAESVNNPIYSTAIGLLKYELKLDRAHAVRIREKKRFSIRNIIQPIIDWFEELF
ncbi:cell division protein FtsA [bacterium]|nr:cell division protein FtsA [bacterium]